MPSADMTLGTMRAVVAVSPGRVQVREMPMPVPSGEEVTVRVTHSWISPGTEGSFVRGERIAGDTPRAETDPLPFPHVPGYQKVGVVEAVGAEVRGFSVGDSVFATVSQTPGMFYSTGGHVSPAVTHVSQVRRLPEGMDPVAASGLVLAQVGVNCGMRPEVRPGDTAVVLGDGLVGHWTAQTLLHRGARVVMVGRHDDRLARLPASDRVLAVNERRRDPTQAAREWAEGRGVQVVVDTVGSIAALEAFLPTLRHGAHLVSAGFYGRNGRLDLQKLRDRELTLHAPAGWSDSRLEMTLDLLRRGELHTLPLITHRFPVERAEEAFDLILSKREPFLGVLLDW